jgi:4,5-DOPA dioxygenase extradiol
MPMPHSIPTLFLSHGAPDILLSDQPSVAVFRTLAARLPRPRGILVVSAHWIDDPVGITGDGELATIHDFGGFPAALYAERYPAHGDRALSERLEALLRAAGIPHRRHATRGLDHGAWVPLKLAYPKADIPVIQVSLPVGTLDASASLGAALSPLTGEGVLVIGSGGSVHNLGALKPLGPPDPWASRFEEWLAERVEGNDLMGLVTAASHPSDMRMAHPTVEHLAPLAVAWAAGAADSPGRRFAEGFTYGNLGMSCYAFGAVEHLSEIPVP